jgi:hypothetical protein
LPYNGLENKKGADGSRRKRMREKQMEAGVSRWKQVEAEGRK